MGQAFPSTISRTAAVVAPGLMVLAIILFMGKVSGAHLNPAVSLAFSLRGLPVATGAWLHRRPAGRGGARGVVPPMSSTSPRRSAPTTRQPATRRSTPS